MTNKELSTLLIKAKERADKFHRQPPGKSQYCAKTLVEQIDMILDYLEMEDKRVKF